MKKDFQKAVVIVTGASSGIGASTAKLLAQQGAIVVLVARTESNLLKVSESIQSKGGSSLIIPTDVSDQNQVKQMVDQVVHKFGRIDVLVSNAGSSYLGKVEDHDFVDNLRHMMETDYFGTVFCVKAVLPIMQQQGFGHIVAMSSVVGLKSFAKFTGYSSVMHAITGFADGLRQELVDTNTKVTIIHPALTQTNLLDHTDANRMPAPFKAMTPMAPEEVASALVKGMHHRKTKIIVPFQPRVLLFLNALSVTLGDRFVRFVSNRKISSLLGMYRGRLYHDQNRA